VRILANRSTGKHRSPVPLPAEAIGTSNTVTRGGLHAATVSTRLTPWDSDAPWVDVSVDGEAIALIGDRTKRHSLAAIMGDVDPVTIRVPYTVTTVGPPTYAARLVAMGAHLGADGAPVFVPTAAVEGSEAALVADLPRGDPQYLVGFAPDGTVHLPVRFEGVARFEAEEPVTVHVEGAAHEARMALTRTATIASPGALVVPISREHWENLLMHVGLMRTPLETWEFMYAKHMYAKRNGAKVRQFDLAGAPPEFIERHPELVPPDPRRTT